MGEKLLRWRERQRPGAIMRPATFERIVRQIMRRYGFGRERAEKIAGAAYWQTVRAKYRERRRGSPVARAIRDRSK